MGESVGFSLTINKWIGGAIVGESLTFIYFDYRHTAGRAFLSNNEYIKAIVPNVILFESTDSGTDDDGCIRAFFKAMTATTTARWKSERRRISTIILSAFVYIMRRARGSKIIVIGSVVSA